MIIKMNHYLKIILIMKLKNFRKSHEEGYEKDYEEDYEEGYKEGYEESYKEGYKKNSSRFHMSPQRPVCPSANLSSRRSATDEPSSAAFAYQVRAIAASPVKP